MFNIKRFLRNCLSNLHQKDLSSESYINVTQAKNKIINTISKLAYIREYVYERKRAKEINQ